MGEHGESVLIFCYFALPILVIARYLMYRRQYWGNRGWLLETRGDRYGRSNF